MMEKRVKLKKVNPIIICTLCKGYLVDATTITECLHAFCKSCIVKFLLENNTCPKCGILIHQSHPLNYISFGYSAYRVDFELRQSHRAPVKHQICHDRTMQDIVYKLVPKLQENEKQRQLDFYKKRGLPLPNGDVIEDDKQNIEKSSTDKEETTTGATMIEDDKLNIEKSSPDKEENKDHHRSDEQVNVCLECKEKNTIKTLKRRVLRLSAQATVTHLKKFVSLKVFDTTDRYKDVDILCNEELLGKDHMLKFIMATRWRVDDGPLLLHYRRRLEL